MNVEGMLPFENMVADFIKESGFHVLYRVSPIFEENNVLASGVQIEAKSVEDNGEGILFNVYCYNVQPEITIDYSTGDSSYVEEKYTENTKNEINQSEEITENKETEKEVITQPESNNSNSAIMVWKSETGSKYHSINNCGRMNPNKATQITKEQAESQGLKPCSKCY